MNSINSAPSNNNKKNWGHTKKGTSPMEEGSQEKLGYLSYQVQ